MIPGTRIGDAVHRKSLPERLGKANAQDRGSAENYGPQTTVSKSYTNTIKLLAAFWPPI